MRCMYRLLPLFALVASASFSQADDRIDTLSQDALQEAFRVLQRDYIRQEALSYDELNKAALDGLLRRLAFGAQLVSTSNSESANDPPVSFFSDLVTPKIGYVRLATFQPGELKQFDDALNGFFDAEAETLILDLRVPNPNTDLTTAARLLDRFVPSTTLLFKVQKPGDKRPTLFFSQVPPVKWKDEIVILIDEETTNAGEVIAAVIASNRNCFLVGQATKGKTVQYEQIPLTEDLMLRFAVAEVLLGDDSSLFQVGVEPDLALQIDLPSKHKVFAASGSGPLSPYLFERARPRMNEAALVHETDPELDYHLARARGEITAFDKVPLQDRVLQRTIDFLSAMEHLDKATSPPPHSPE